MAATASGSGTGLAAGYNGPDYTTTTQLCTNDWICTEIHWRIVCLCYAALQDFMQDNVFHIQLAQPRLFISQPPRANSRVG